MDYRLRHEKAEDDIQTLYNYNNTRLKALSIKHDEAIMQNRNNMENKLPLEYKKSKEHLKLLVMETGLIKQKRLPEAH